MTGGEFSLQHIRASRNPELLGTVESGYSATNEQLVPLRSILVLEQDGLAQWAHPRFGSGGLELHERD